MRNNLIDIINTHMEKTKGERLGKFKVADINFAYDNGHLVKLLIERGKAIKNVDTKKEISINRRIEEYIKSKEFSGDLMIPTKAFVTFETEEAYNLMLE
jgi:sporulation protein YlmC with PRC-barrel domain